MSRAGIIWLSLVCCAFGVLAVAGPDSTRAVSYGLNVLLAISLYVLAGRDLVARGWQLGYLFAGAYLLPLVGLVVYVGLSNRPRIAEPAPA